MLRQLDYLDEAFIYNYDDYDLGYRIWRGGYTLIHDKRVTAHHLKLPQGGSRRDLVGTKRRLNKYTAKYYFLAKHFGSHAMKVEFINDMVLAVWDNRLRLDRTLTELYMQIKSLRDYRKYGVQPKNASTVDKAKEMKSNSSLISWR